MKIKSGYVLIQPRFSEEILTVSVQSAIGCSLQLYQDDQGLELSGLPIDRRLKQPCYEISLRNALRLRRIVRAKH